VSLLLTVEPHPLLELAAFVTTFPRPLGELAGVLALPDLIEAGSTLGPVETALAVRDLLRHGGFKPAGRSKPASEYVARAVPEGRLGAINPAVDACNAASFFGGLPISVVDLGRTAGALRVGIADEGASYVFNAGGQVLSASGLLCLHDGEGPCANAVKDSQRTKTHDGTEQTLSLVWGTVAAPGRAAAVAAWYRGVLDAAGCRTAAVSPTRAEPSG
jgi:hypothetical protein